MKIPNAARSPRRQFKDTRFLIFVSGTLFGFLLSTIVQHAYTQWALDPAQDSVLTRTLEEAKAAPSGIAQNNLLMVDVGGIEEDERWSHVHVFTGNSSHILEASAISADFFHTARWFSQLRQDLVVSTLLNDKKNGYFVDLAANDAVRISNTYALESYHNWNGLCIEPNSIYWAGLTYRKCHVVGAVVGRNSMEEIVFKFPNRAPPKGGIVGEGFDNSEPSKFGEDERRYTVSLAELFDHFGSPPVIDYLSLDVEGAETFVMNTFPFDRYRFNVLTVERPDETLGTLLRSNGYILLKQLKKWGETLWVHTSVHSSLNLSALDIETETYKYKES